MMHKPMSERSLRLLERRKLCRLKRPLSLNRDGRGDRRTFASDHSVPASVSRGSSLTPVPGRLLSISQELVVK